MLNQCCRCLWTTVEDFAADLNVCLFNDFFFFFKEITSHFYWRTNRLSSNVRTECKLYAAMLFGGTVLVFIQINIITLTYSCQLFYHSWVCAILQLFMNMYGVLLCTCNIFVRGIQNRLNTSMYQLKTLNCTYMSYKQHTHWSFCIYILSKKNACVSFSAIV